MISSRMKWTKKGSKDNTSRVAWSKYLKFIVENEEYYFKQKAYATYCDGWIETQEIKKETYKSAVKRNKDCKEVILEKEISEASTDCITLIFSQKYQVSEDKVRNSIIKASAAVKQIKEHSAISEDTEYKLFKRILELHLDSIKNE